MMNLAPRYRLQFGQARPTDKTRPRSVLVAKLMELRRRLDEHQPVDVFMRRGEEKRRFGRIDDEVTT